MMQQVASAKTDVAAFAALQGSNDQADSSAGFEQILQQQNTLPAVKGVSRQPEPDIRKISLTEPPVKTDKKSVITSPGDKPAKPEHHQNISANGKEPSAADKTAVTAQNTSPENIADEEEAILTKSAEEWLQIVWSLQEPLDAENTESLAINAQATSPETINNLEVLQDWLAPLDDKLAALTQLIETKPELQKELQNWLATTDLSDNAALQKLIVQALSLASARQGDAQTDVSAVPVVMPANLQQELLQLSKDIALLLKYNRLSATEIEQVNQALNQSLSQHTPLTQELKNLLSSKLESISSLAVGADKQVKSMPAEMPANVLTQPDEASNLTATNVPGAVLALPTARENLLALLDKINGGQKAGVEPAVVMPLKTAGQQVEAILPSDVMQNDQDNSQELLSKTLAPLPERSASASQANTDKPTGSKDVVTGNNPSVAKSPVPEVNVTNNSELKALLSLSADELDAALTAVAQRVAALLRDESKNTGNLPAKISGDAAGLTAATGKDILAALKAGVAEFKEQLAAGREPGLDLQALVSQAVEKTTDGSMLVKVAEGLDKSLRALSQNLAAINQFNDSASLSQALNVAALDSQLTQAEQHKALQVNQFDNKLDKALNLHKPEGHQQLADKVRWMVNTGNLIAEIRLDPAELGSVHVRVSVSAESATVNFVVQSQQTRDVLEAATPKLREMLAEKGIELGQSTVKQDSQTKQDNQGQSGQHAKNAATGQAAGDHLNDDESRMMSNSRTQSASSNTIDYFV